MHMQNVVFLMMGLILFCVLFADKPIIRQNMSEELDNKPEGREKRQVTMPLDSANVISVAVYLDRTFMNRYTYLVRW